MKIILVLKCVLVLLVALACSGCSSASPRYVDGNYYMVPAGGCSDVEFLANDIISCKRNFYNQKLSPMSDDELFEYRKNSYSGKNTEIPNKNNSTGGFSAFIEAFGAFVAGFAEGASRSSTYSPALSNPGTVEMYQPPRATAPTPNYSLPDTPINRSYNTNSGYTPYGYKSSNGMIYNY